jgi:hypothetical protein
MWKKGRDINAKMEEKLSFLCHNGRMVQIGRYLRNQNIRDDSFKELYKKRAECEKRYGHSKSTVKF